METKHVISAVDFLYLIVFRAAFCDSQCVVLIERNEVCTGQGSEKWGITPIGMGYWAHVDKSEQ